MITVASWRGSWHCSYDHDQTISTSRGSQNASGEPTPTAEHELTNSSHRLRAMKSFQDHSSCSSSSSPLSSPSGGGGASSSIQSPMGSLVIVPSPVTTARRLLASQSKPRNCLHQQQPHPRRTRCCPAPSRQQRVTRQPPRCSGPVALERRCLNDLPIDGNRHCKSHVSFGDTSVPKRK